LETSEDKYTGRYISEDSTWGSKPFPTKLGSFNTLNKAIEVYIECRDNFPLEQILKESKKLTKFENQ